jgi:hypothetical protein
MPKFRIKEISSGTFSIQKKGLFFWHTLNEGDDTLIFYNLSSAKDWIQKYGVKFRPRVVAVIDVHPRKIDRIEQ